MWNGTGHQVGHDCTWKISTKHTERFPEQESRDFGYKHELKSLE